MKNALEEAMGLYEKTEQHICGNAGSGIKAQAKTETASSSFWDDLVDFFGKIVGEIGAIVGGIISSITTAWSNLAAFFEGAIGIGNVTDEQPAAGWVDSVIAGTAGEATGSAADGTVDGTPAYVYYTEANNPKYEDGILQKLPYEEFINKGISGYISAA